MRASAQWATIFSSQWKDSNFNFHVCFSNIIFKTRLSVALLKYSYHHNLFWAQSEYTRVLRRIVSHNQRGTLNPKEQSKAYREVNFRLARTENNACKQWWIENPTSGFLNITVFQLQVAHKIPKKRTGNLLINQAARPFLAYSARVDHTQVVKRKEKPEPVFL